MKSNEVPKSERIRELVLAEIERLRRDVEARFEAGRPNRFVWLDSELWIDRERNMVLSVPTARELGAVDRDTVPADAADGLKARGCRRGTRSLREIVGLLASFVTGIGIERKLGSLCAELVNYTVMQPRVNPAFGSLVWLALEREAIRQLTPAADLGFALGRMCFDLSVYPASRVEAPAVRAAQITFVRANLDGKLDEARWLAASEEDWAAHSAELLRLEEPTVFFGEIAEAAERALAHRERAGP